MNDSFTIEGRLAEMLEHGDLILRDSTNKDMTLSARDKLAIVAALRIVHTAKDELIRETPLTKTNFSLD